MFTVEDLSYIPDKGTSPYPAIPEINITLQGVTNLLSSCDPHKSLGPDNLYAAFLKQVSMHGDCTNVDIPVSAVLER